MRTLNLGILAHVDAGKTTLTERLLHAAGVIDEIGSVDDGSTQTDTLVLERQRGITIKSAVVSFVIADLVINLIDTPGHPDFIAEVERVLGVLDGAVLVVSAVEGVQAQTRVLMRALQRLRVPTLIFVNKIDRGGAQYERLLQSIAEKLSPAIILERPIGVGAAVEIIGKVPNPFHATVGLRVDPAPVDAGVQFRLEVELGSIPLSFHKAVEDTVKETLRAGIYGWEVTDCTVTMTHSGYWSPSSTAGDFRNLRRSC